LRRRPRAACPQPRADRGFMITFFGGREFRYRHVLQTARMALDNAARVRLLRQLMISSTKCNTYGNRGCQARRTDGQSMTSSSPDDPAISRESFMDLLVTVLTAPLFVGGRRRGGPECGKFSGTAMLARLDQKLDVCAPSTLEIQMAAASSRGCQGMIISASHSGETSERSDVLVRSPNRRHPYNPPGAGSYMRRSRLPFAGPVRPTRFRCRAPQLLPGHPGPACGPPAGTFSNQVRLLAGPAPPGRAAGGS